MPDVASAPTVTGSIFMQRFRLFLGQWHRIKDDRMEKYCAYIVFISK